MRKRRQTQLLTLGIGSLAVTILWTQRVHAAIIWDYSPETTGNSSGNTDFENISTDQNYAEIVSFANPVQLTGMAIYSNASFAAIGDSVTLRIWTDSAGTPDTLIHNFTDTISMIDTEGVGSWSTVNRKFADFSLSPISLAANTPYWIGMSGTNTDIKQARLTISPGDGDGQAAVFSDTSFNFFSSFGDLAVRLHGEVQMTPEPNSVLGLLVLGILGGVSLIKAKKA